MTIDVRIRTYDERPTDFKPAVRLASLEGATIGIISNGKKGKLPFFNTLADELRSLHGAAGGAWNDRQTIGPTIGVEMLLERGRIVEADQRGRQCTGCAHDASSERSKSWSAPAFVRMSIDYSTDGRSSQASLWAGIEPAKAATNADNRAGLVLFRS